MRRLDSPPSWTDMTQRVMSGAWAADHKIPWTQGPHQGLAPLIYVAMEAPDSALLRTCLAAGARLTARFDVEGLTPAERPSLLDAVRHDAQLLLLLQQGLLWHVSTTDAFRDFPLHRAAAEGWMLSVRWMLARGASVKMRNGMCDLPLHVTTRHAVKPGSFTQRQAVVKALIAAGADLAQRDHHGETALVGAARRCPAMAPLLLSLGQAHQDLQLRVAEPLLMQTQRHHPEAAWALNQMQRLQNTWREHTMTI